MPYALREFTCIDCGGSVKRRLPDKSKTRCHRCAITYSSEQQRQLAAHEGPEYERWRWAWAAGIIRAAKQAPLAGVKKVA